MLLYLELQLLPVLSYPEGCPRDMLYGWNAEVTSTPVCTIISGAAGAVNDFQAANISRQNSGKLSCLLQALWQSSLPLVVR